MRERQSLQLPSHEVLSQLARDDPQAYETLRREVIDSFIDNAPEGIQPRLRGIQFRVDCVRRLSQSALGSTLKISKLMWESFLSLDRGWQSLARLEKGQYDPARDAEFSPQGNARILEFRPPAPR